MASPNNVNILISVKNKASEPLRQVRKDVSDFRNELVQFNRRLFTASAVYATFAAGFRKAFDFAKVGADFDMFRATFNSTFDEGYLKRLRIASKGTMDAMSMMQIATQNHARGLKKAETEKIFTLSVGAAKLLGTSTAEAAKKMSKALHGLSVTGLQQFMVALNTNNQFKNMDVMIKRLTKGLNSAGLETTNFRKMALRELEIALGEISAQTGDAKTQFMVLGASADSLRQVFGSFMSRAIAPLIAYMSRLNWDIFDKFNQILDGGTTKLRNLRNGLIDFVQMGGGIIAAAAGMVGGLSLLALLSATLGLSFGGLVGALTLFTVGIKKAKQESGGWMQMLSDFGTILKFLYQAVATYDAKTGKSTFSGDVLQRLFGMDDSTYNMVISISKGLILAGEAAKGFGEGLNKVFDAASSLLGFFGLYDKDTKQFTQRTEDWAKSLGKAAGVIAGIFALKAGGGLIGQIPILGSLLQKIPVIGRIFQGGGDGKPKGTANDPIYTRSSDLMGKAAGGLFGGIMPILTKVLGGLWAFLSSPVFLAVAGGLAAGGAIGTGLDWLSGKVFGTSMSSGLANLAYGQSAGANAGNDFASSNKGQLGVLNKAFVNNGFQQAGQDYARQANLADLTQQMESMGGKFNTKALEEIAKGGVDMAETNELIQSIVNFIRDPNHRPNRFVSDAKPGR